MVGIGEMEQDIDLFAKDPKPVGLARVEFPQFDPGKGLKGIIGAEVVERAKGGKHAVAPFGKEANEVAADMAIRTCDQNLHGCVRITVSAAGTDIEMKISLQVKQSIDRNMTQVIRGEA